MINALADNNPYLFITVCDHLQLKWNPQSRAEDLLVSRDTLRTPLTVITEQLCHSLIRAVHSENVSGTVTKALWLSGITSLSATCCTPK